MAMAILPQAGPQSKFLSSNADIAIYGGAAGGGKTWALLLEPIRHINVKGFGAVFFRRNATQIRNEGGLWDESVKLYPLAGGDPKEHNLEWKFKSGSTVTMTHLEHDKTVLNWQGSQIPLILFDELTHFSEKQFFYMMSRSRSMCGVRPYIRATCNPDADSWVAEFIAWWIDQDTGIAIPERSGIVRYFVRVNDTIIWGATREELEGYTMVDDNGQTVPIPAKSLTFIPSKLTDNKALMAADPGYMANLMALPYVERERLLGGNWKIRPAAGLFFSRSWVQPIDVLPHDLIFARGWDLAATVKTENNDPDWMCGTKIGKTRGGLYVVADHVFDRVSPAGQRRLLLNTAQQDEEFSSGTEISLPQEPAQAGKVQVHDLTTALDGYNVRSSLESGDKLTRFLPFSAQAEQGNVVYLRSNRWNERWLSTLEAFPSAAHDDDVDSTSRAFNSLNSPRSKVAMFLSERNRRAAR